MTAAPSAGVAPLPFGLLKELERSGDIFRDLGPKLVSLHHGHWPRRPRRADLPMALTAAWAVHWIRYPNRARGHAANPVMAQFWRAPSPPAPPAAPPRAVVFRSAPPLPSTRTERAAWTSDSSARAEQGSSAAGATVAVAH